MTKKQIIYDFSLFYLRGLEKSLSSMGNYYVWRDPSDGIFCEKHLKTGEVYIRTYTYDTLEKYIPCTLDFSGIEVKKIITKILIENDV